MQALWYYIDPFIGSTGGGSTIREDSASPLTLDLQSDRMVEFIVDSDNKLQAKLSADADGNGVIDPGAPPQFVSPDAVKGLWRAGLKLWERGADRTIYTQTDGITLIPFLNSSNGVNRKLLQASDATEAEEIVSFVKGTDSVPSTRDRGVVAYGTSTKRVWKLGDIISSTPALQSGVSLGSYHLPAPRGYNDASYARFANYSGYKKNRGTVYVGANDGMLHAFRLGRLQVRPDSSESWPAGKKAALSGTDLGKEEWAFVPRNALPYLRYLKEPLYPHLYYVDGSITLADVSLGDSGDTGCDRRSYWNCSKDTAKGTNWRTVLIGGMGLGGATCLDDAGRSCVKAPPQITGQATVGLSSYFALDVTSQTSDGTGPTPKLLWEFSHPELGYATSGAAIVKINARKDDGTLDVSKNGRWFAVFASGPTGSIDGSCQFQGKSDQNLKLFVVDLNAIPPLTEGSNYWVIDTGIHNAFGGNMTGAGIDTDRWNISAPGYYEDDALYFGYTRNTAANGSGTWTTGGVLRVFTKGIQDDPGKWVASAVIDDIGPVTGTVSKLQDRGNSKLWLYFGTGRYFYNQDDLTTGRALFGVREPCYRGKETGSRDTMDNGCSAALLKSDLFDATDRAPSTPVPKGWWIGLDGGAGGFGSERLTANPTVSTGGSVFFTTFKVLNVLVS